MQRFSNLHQTHVTTTGSIEDTCTSIASHVCRTECTGADAERTKFTNQAPGAFAATADVRLQWSPSGKAVRSQTGEN